MNWNRVYTSSHLAVLALVAVAFATAGCAGAPRASFDSYLNSFSAVRGQAQDLYLRSGIIAEDIANRPETEGTVADRLKKLEVRRTLLKTRLGALSLINRYNGILSHLVAGTSPDDLRAQITGLQQDLSSFNVSGITKVAGKALPYAEVLAQGVALVEDAIKKAKFRDAVNAAQKPLAGIIDVLIVDADDLEDVTVQELQRQQNPYREQIDSFSRRFNSRLKSLKFNAESSELQALLAKVNDARQSMERTDVKPLAPQPGANAVDPAAVDVDALTALTGQITNSVLAYNKIEAQIKAQHALIVGYKDALETTKKAFVALAGDVEATQIAATSDFIKQALELKKASLQLQEAK